MLAWAFLAVTLMLVHFHRVAAAVLAAPIEREFAVGAATLGVMAAAYFYAYGAVQVPAGALVDRLGVRRVVVVSLATTAGGTLLLAGAPGLAGALIARAILGIGVAALWVATVKVLSVQAAKNRYATLLGLTMLVGNGGAILGALPFAAAVALWGWRAPLLGAAAVTASLTVLAFAVLPAGRYAGQTTTAPGTLRGALSDRRLLLCYATIGALTGPFMAFSAVWSVPYLQTVGALDLTASAGLSTFLTLGLLAGAPLIGVLSDRVFHGTARPLLILGGLAPTTWAILALWPAALPAGLLVPALLAAGLVATSFALVTAAAKDLSPPGAVGTVAGLINGASYLSAAILQPLFGLVLDLGGRTDPQSFRVALLIYAAVAATGLLAARRLVQVSHG